MRVRGASPQGEDEGVAGRSSTLTRCFASTSPFGGRGDFSLRRREISILWLNLALLAPFTPSGEAGNEARVASFGTPLTRRHCTGVASFVAALASSRVTRSGELLKQLHSVAFRCIPYRLRGAGMRGSRLRGNDGGIRVSDACNQCRGRPREGAMGSCRQLELARPAEPPGYTGDGTDVAGHRQPPMTPGQETSDRLRCRDNGK